MNISFLLCWRWTLSYFIIFWIVGKGTKQDIKRSSLIYCCMGMEFKWIHAPFEVLKRLRIAFRSLLRLHMLESKTANQAANIISITFPNMKTEQPKKLVPQSWLQLRIWYVQNSQHERTQDVTLHSIHKDSKQLGVNAIYKFVSQHVSRYNQRY